MDLYNCETSNIMLLEPRFCKYTDWVEEHICLKFKIALNKMSLSLNLIRQLVNSYCFKI